MKHNQVTSLNSTELAKRVASELGVTIQVVDSVLKSLSSVCSEYVAQGYSFSLSEDIFFRVGYVGQRIVEEGRVLPTAVIHRIVSQETGISKPVVDGILDRCLTLMVSHYLLGASSYISGLVSLNPSATLSYNRVTYGKSIKDAREEGGYRIQIVLSDRVRNAKFA